MGIARIELEVSEHRLPGLVRALSELDCTYTVKVGESSPTEETKSPRINNPNTKSAQATLKALEAIGGKGTSVEVGEQLAKDSEFQSVTAGPCLSTLYLNGWINRSRVDGKMVYSTK